MTSSVLEYKLVPVYDRAKSFYGKAIVKADEIGNKKLYSYSSLVAEIDNGVLKIYNGLYTATRRGMFQTVWEEDENYLNSQTTRRHINEFMLQEGFQKMSKKEMINYANDQN